MNNQLRGINLKKSYHGRQIVKNVSLRVNQGEIVGLLGPNGAGKTTTFYMMVGLIAPDKGEIWLENNQLTTLTLHLRSDLGIGYLPQESSIFRELTVEENILCVLEIKNIKRESAIHRCNELLSEFGLEKIRKSKGHALSGGERRRVELARALAISPRFILLDEPFAGVDPLAVADIQILIRQLKAKNIGVLITDHNVRETLGIVDRAYIMGQGEIMVEGTPEEIVNNDLARKFYLGQEFTL